MDEGIDFTCSGAGVALVCRPRNDKAKAAFIGLQSATNALAAALGLLAWLGSRRRR